MSFESKAKDLKACLDTWGGLHRDLIERWRFIVNDLRASSVLTYTMYFVAVRELLDLTQTTIQAPDVDVVKV